MKRSPNIASKKMKSIILPTFWLNAIRLLIIPIGLLYLFQFGYGIVDKAYEVNGSNCNLDQQTISLPSFHSSGMISPGIVILLLFIISLGSRIHKKDQMR